MPLNEVRIRKNVMLMKSQGASDDKIRMYLAGEGLPVFSGQGQTGIAQASALNAGAIPSGGAPVSTRALVGTRNRQDQLATLRQKYPDAQPFGEDNFAFTDPKTGQLRLFNPPGVDVGDVAQQGRAISETIGGGLGAAAGSILGSPGVGTAVGGGLGASGGGALFDALTEQLGAVDSRTLPTRVADAGADLGLNMAIPPAIGAAGKVASGIKRGAGALAPTRNKLASAGSEELTKLFDFFGITPRAGAITGNKTIQGLERGLESIPGGATVVQRADARSIAELKQAVDNVASKVGQVLSREQAGDVLSDAARNAVVRYKELEGNLFRGIEKVIGPEPVPVQNSLVSFRDVLSEFQSTPALQSRVTGGAWSLFEDFATDVGANRGALPYKALKRYRTDIGESIGNPIVATLSKQKKAASKRLYAALSKDMENAAEQAGIGKEWRAANAIAERIRNHEIKLLKSVQEKGLDDKAFDAVMGSAKSGGKRLAMMRRSIPKEEWETVVGTTIGNLGLAKAGAQSAEGDVFSAAAYLTSWNNLSDGAKQVLFSGTKYSPLRQEMDGLAKVAGAFKDVDSLTNRSRTGNVMATIKTLWAPLVAGGSAAVFGGASAGVGMGLTVGAAGIGGPYYAARLMTNPKFVKWLTTATKAAKQGAKATIKQTAGPGGATFRQAVKAPQKNTMVHLGRLGALAESEPTIREEVYQYMQALGLQPNQ